jgi:nucleoside-diphosphate-sugar epimerase
MKKHIFRKILGALIGFFAIVYVAQLVMNLGSEMPVASLDRNTDRHKTVAIFGATGTAGDGLLKAAMNDPDVEKIHVITRRPSPRIEAGVASGLVEMTIHMDYLDYSAIHEKLAGVDAVYWAIGITSFGMDEDYYRKIHLDFPRQLITEWMSIRREGDLSFHYISGNGANIDSRAMWAREKARAELALFGVADKSNLRVIAYRPDYIAPTKEQSSIGTSLLYGFLVPINSAVRATAIGEAMLEVSARGPEVGNGTVLQNKDIVSYSQAYQQHPNPP